MGQGVGGAAGESGRLHPVLNRSKSEGSLAAMKQLLSTIVLGLALVWGAAAHAGGHSGWFKIVSVEGDSSSAFRLTLLKHSGENDFLENWRCERTVIVVRYDPEPFWRRTWTGRLVTWQKHVAAFKFLQEARAKNAPFRLGMMGARGLPESDRQCELLARGLARLPEHGGSFGIYGFYHPM